MDDHRSQVLEKEVAYVGDWISVRSLEDTLQDERALLNGQVAELARMR